MKIKYPLLLDGGLSNELEKQGCNFNDRLWSAKLLEVNPEAIIQTHLSYLKAGAQCITTSSYQGSEYRGDYGISDEQLRDFHLPRLRLLDRSNADFFACETIPSFQEAKVLAEILKQ